MKIHSFRTVLLAIVVVLTSLAGINRASAIDVGVAVGTPPPPPGGYERPWAPPYRGAVWIRPHHEWRDGRWVWIHGYYGYPPRRGSVWVEGHWGRGYWHPGHWR